MSTLHLYNPEDDLALAADILHFTPPKAAVELARAFATLPAWWSEPGDCILATHAESEWLTKLKTEHNIDVKIYEAGLKIDHVSPWGWSKNARQTLINQGIDIKLLPTDRELDDIRQLSHRQLTTKIYAKLAAGELYQFTLPQFPIEVKNIVQISNRIKKGENIFIKSPWSSSGRGILDSRTAPPAQIIRLSEGVIRRQGSVMIEPALDKILDFAMLYDIRNGVAQYVGLSVFFNESYSAYSGNLIAPEYVLQAEIEKYVSRMQIEYIRTEIAHALETEIGEKYSGPVGVDMMVYRHTDGNYNIAPCVEVNLRMTMGRVAHEIFRRHMPKDFTGIMRICGPDKKSHLLRLTPPHPKFNLLVIAD